MSASQDSSGVGGVPEVDGKVLDEVVLCREDDALGCVDYLVSTNRLRSFAGEYTQIPDWQDVSGLSASFPL